MTGIQTCALPILNQIIFEHGGTVDKFIGDAVMAIFGAPKIHGDDAFRAVESGHQIIELANELGAKHFWITLPHLADETYVKGVAALARDILDPGIVVVLEWSNEAWNIAFTQGVYYRGINPQSPGTPAGQDAAQAFEWWLEEWPQTERVFPVVMGWQADNGTFASQMLATANANGRVRGVGCAQYAKPSNQRIEEWSAGASPPA